MSKKEPFDLNKAFDDLDSPFDLPRRDHSTQAVSVLIPAICTLVAAIMTLIVVMGA